ncbi:hypothetical protein BG003_009726, partial [Podila horticola]
GLHPGLDFLQGGCPLEPPRQEGGRLRYRHQAQPHLQRGPDQVVQVRLRLEPDGCQGSGPRL